MAMLWIKLTLCGCKEKEAARYVIERNPKSINEALKWVKSSIANQRAIYGTRHGSYSSRNLPYAQRQVTFSEHQDTSVVERRTPPASLSPSRSENNLETEVRDLVTLVGQLLKERTDTNRSRRLSQSPEQNRQEIYRSADYDRRPYRSPPPPNFRSRNQSPQTPRSPSPYRGPRSSGFSNHQFRRSFSPSSAPGTSSPSKDLKQTALNRNESGQ